MELTIPGDDFQALLAVQQAISSRLDPSVVLQMIIDEARRLYTVETGALFLTGQPLQAADLLERQQRIGELHDAVTQTLFSASLIADVLPRLLERDPQEGAARMEELRHLTRGALAEMRTLLMELRPSALTASTFDELIAQLADCCAAWAHIPVDFALSGAACSACYMPEDVQIALYRITQDALKNICREARASQVSISLICDPTRASCRVHLMIAYQGSGRTTQASMPGSAAAESWQERAKRIGASIQVDDPAGQNNQISINWPG